MGVDSSTVIHLLVVDSHSWAKQMGVPGNGFEPPCMAKNNDERGGG